MLYSYNDCISSFGNDYQIKKSVSDGKLFKIRNGIYSDKEYVSELEIVCFKYPMAVFTMDSAFYYHALTDVIPEAYHLATDKNAAKIKTAGIKQYFYPRDKFEVGISQSTFQNISIRIYDRERMLIELIKNKDKIPFDYYKEIIENYRKLVDSLDIEKIQDYVMSFSGSDNIARAIQLEVL
jgi:predicted transcriptional regulator of viral defense system